MNFERTFLSNHIKKYYKILDSIPATDEVQMDKVHYCERFIELMIDLAAQLPTRRFFNTGKISMYDLKLKLFTLNYYYFLKTYCWTKVHFVGLLIAPVWTSCVPPHGFHSQGSSLASTLTCLSAVNLRVASGATPVFSTRRVHTEKVCTQQQRAGHGRLLT